MAIDTRAKRQNAAQVGCPLPVSVLPSGALAQLQRFQIGWSYFEATAPAGSGQGVIYSTIATTFDLAMGVNSSFVIGMDVAPVTETFAVALEIAPAFTIDMEVAPKFTIKMDTD